MYKRQIEASSCQRNYPSARLQRDSLAGLLVNVERGIMHFGLTRLISQRAGKRRGKRTKAVTSSLGTIISSKHILSIVRRIGGLIIVIRIFHEGKF